jgi:peptide/nickel transport system ATP-binding protein
MTDPLLSVRNLHVRFRTDEGVLRAVDGVSFDLNRGETVCLIGESGSGKTVTCETITRLVRTPPAEISEGEVVFDGMDLLAADEATMEEIRGGRIAHVFQNPGSALNPVYTVGWQLVEAIRLHRNVGKAAARERAVGLLDRVGIPEAAIRFHDYPHEFSGGMRQRVVIAMALAADPDLLIADEPTTALDVTTQAQILRLLGDLQAEYGLAVLLVTHDLGIVADVADRVVVMYAGKVMETADVFALFEEPSHPYTRALLRCLPGRSKRMTAIGGDVPDPTDPPSGCRFHPRCRYAIEECRANGQPPLYHVAPGARGTPHGVSCVHYAPGMDPGVVRADPIEVGAREPGRGDGETSGGAGDDAERPGRLGDGGEP